MLLEIAIAAGTGTVLGLRHRAPMLMAASLITLLAALSRHWDAIATAETVLWPLLRVWLDLAALQAGYVVGAYLGDVRPPAWIERIREGRWPAPGTQARRP